MKLLYKLSGIIVFTLCLSSAAYSQIKIAVVKSAYDNVDLVFNNYEIPYKFITYRDLGDPVIYNEFDSIFFPSGLENLYQDNLEVKYAGKNIQSVRLSKNFFELDKDIFSRNLRRFIKRGGAAYFSGYAFKLLNHTYNNFIFFSNFPYMGIPGRIESELLGDLANFSLKNQAALYMNYPGWITLKSIKNAQILSQGKFMTPRGEKSGPLSFLLKEGEGEIIYSSYYSTVYSEFKRFHIMRIAGNKLLQNATGSLTRHFKTPSTRIVDKFLKDESSRMYIAELKPGENTICISSENEPFTYEIYSSDKSLLATIDNSSLNQQFLINSMSHDFCLIKIYPSTAQKKSIFTIISASGGFLSLNTWNWLKVSLGIFGLFFLIAFIKVTYRRLRI